MGGDAGRDLTGDGRWLTYREIAQARNIDVQSATKLARRQRWRRQPGNRGMVQVFVPFDWLSQDKSRDESQDASGAEGGDDPGTRNAILARLQEALAAERVRADAADADRRAAMVMIDSFAARADRAEAAIAGERQRADALHDRLDVLQHGLDAARERLGATSGELALVRAALDQAQGETKKAREAAEALRRAEADRKARGVLARLRAALRGE